MKKSLPCSCRKMIVQPIKTRVLVPPRDDLLDALAHSMKSLAERSIVVVTSKAVSIWEGRALPQSTYTREELVPEEAEYYFPKTKTRLFEYQAAIRHNALLASAGIDKSNSADYFTLLPLNPNQSAQKIWLWLRKTYKVTQCGVLVTDSHLMPLRRGTVGISIGFYGFEPLTDYRGTPDLFGHALQVTLRNVADGIAAAAVTVMGEGNESTPAAIVTDIPFVRFISGPYRPKNSRDGLLVEPKEDVFYPLLRKAKWKKGRAGKLI